MTAESSAYYIAKLGEKDRRAASPWIAVADRLPPDDEGVVLVHSTESGFGVEWVEDIDATITHWMPIPDLPEAAP